MKRLFTETSQPSPWRRVQEEVRRGGVQVALGLFFVGLLILGGTTGAFFSEELNTVEGAETHHPPHNVLLQRLLYHPQTRLDSVSRSKDKDSFFGGPSAQTSTASQEPNNEGRPRIVSRPLYTAVVGETYRYRVQVESPDGTNKGLSYEVESGPSEMSVDASGLLTWTPQGRPPGGEAEVGIAAYNDDGRGTKQTFDLHVGETPHPLGTDWQGRGMGAALLLGARWGFLPGCIASIIALLFGSLVGGLAGYYGQTTDRLLTYVSTVTESVPSLILLLLAAVIFRYNIFLIMGVVGVILSPRVANAVKSKVQSLKSRQFVEASQELGLRDRVILWRDIIWYNARPQLLLHASKAFAFAIIVEVTLSYLNLSLQNDVSWGSLLSEGRSELLGGLYAPVVLTSMAIVASIAAFYLLSDGIRRRYGVDRV